jgi:predicted hexulose-6-phosphate isomerase
MLEAQDLRNLQENLIGLYEKALPKQLSWEERLVAAKDAGFDFMEISIDETDDRIGRLHWSKSERTKLMECIHRVNMPILSMCLSANRRYPIGSEREETRNSGIQLIRDAIDFALDCGVRVIQLAGYDEYAYPSTETTVRNFHDSLSQCACYAQEKAVMLALETMENDLMDSISKAKHYVDAIRSPWLKIYPDLGNLCATGHDIEQEFLLGMQDIVSIHLKDTLPGIVREIAFGDGNVDFVSFFRLLQRENYSGLFVAEMWTDETPCSIAAAKEARAFIADKIAQAQQP